MTDNAFKRRSSRISLKRAATEEDAEDATPVKRHKEELEQDASAAASSSIGSNGSQSEPTRQPFRLLDLPAEIRIEIYRACLTRPFDILMSKYPQPTTGSRFKDSVESDGDRGIITEDSDGDDELTINIQSQPHLLVSPFVPRRSYPRRSTALLTRYSPTTSQPRASNTSGPQPANLLRHAPRRAVVTYNPPQSTAMLTSNTPSIRQPRAMSASRSQTADPLLVNILRTSKLVYKEARPVIYGENSFVLDIDTALYSLTALHQRSRGQIRRLRLTIPSHAEILERFAEVVRLSLRYCWRLQVFTINMPFPNTGNDSGDRAAIYANAFDILRWLPRNCKVVLKGNVSDDIRAVVQKNAKLAEDLDELAYARRQLISSDNERARLLSMQSRR